MYPGLRINKLVLALDLSCTDCVMSSATVVAGPSMISMRKMSTISIDSLQDSVLLLHDVQEVDTR